MRYHLVSRMVSFHLLWAFSLIVHVWQYYLRIPSFLAYFLLSASCLVILRPRNVPVLVFAACVQLAHLYQVLPRVPNSWLFTGIVSLTILWSYLCCVFRQKTWNPTLSSFSSEVLFPLRLETVLLYCVAVFHKLNYDFFNPELSCAVAFYQSYAQLVTFLPLNESAKYAMIFSGVFIELLIAVCLVRARWRRFGVVIAYIFHYFLSLVPFASLHSFSVLMYAMTYLFVVNEEAAGGVSLTQEGKKENWLQGMPIVALGFQVILVIFIILLACFWSGMNHLHIQRQSLNIFGPVFGFILCVFLLMNYLLRKRFPTVSASSENEKPDRRWHQGVIPILVLLNGLSPYLGFGTEHSFSMYSNLRTELEPNHFLLRHQPRFANFQDAVQVTASSLPELQHYVTHRTLIPYYNFHSFLLNNPDVDVTFVLPGTSAVEKNKTQDEKLNQHYSKLIRKFIFMKPVILLGNDNVCRH